jgi:hypothetical protein
MPLQGLTAPIRVEVCHPFLMIQNSIRRDSLFHIYDLRNYELTSAFGIIGQGPDDYVRPWIFNTQFSGFTISDNEKNAIYQIGINEEGQPVSKDKKEVRFFDGPGDAAFINDSLFVRDAGYLAPGLYLLSLEDELPRKTLQFRNPNIMDPYTDPNMATNVHANETRIVLIYHRKRQIDFMDTDFNLIKSVRTKFARPPQKKSSMREMSLMSK